MWCGLDRRADPRWMGDDLGEKKRKGHRGESSTGVPVGRGGEERQMETWESEPCAAAASGPHGKVGDGAERAGRAGCRVGR